MNLKNRLTSAMIAAAAALSMAGLGGPISAHADSGCQFVLGFQTLDNLISTIVGGCVDNQAFAANGDALQHTTNGLMVWRKADNFTAFTNGDQTWVNGPCAVQQRSNAQRFQWETGGQGCGLGNNAPVTSIPNLLNTSPPKLDPSGAVVGVGYSLQLPTVWGINPQLNPGLYQNGFAPTPFSGTGPSLFVAVFPGQWTPATDPIFKFAAGSALNSKTPKGQPSLQTERMCATVNGPQMDCFNAVIQGPSDWAEISGSFLASDSNQLSQVNSILDSLAVQ